MPDTTKKVISFIVSAIVGVILRQVFQVWGIFDPFSNWLGGWLKMHVTPAQVEWTIAGILALLAYAALYRILLRSSTSPVANVALTTDAPRQSSPQRIGSPVTIEFGNDNKYERTEHIDETGIFRRTIHISVFNESLEDISDCNIKLIAATPRPNTGDSPAIFPVHFRENFDLRSKQRKFIQIVSFAENPGNASILERGNIIISAVSGGFFPGWTTIPIPSRDSPAILTLEAFAPGIASRAAHLHIWVDQRCLHAQII